MYKYINIRNTRAVDVTCVMIKNNIVPQCNMFIIYLQIAVGKHGGNPNKLQLPYAECRPLRKRPRVVPTRHFLSRTVYFVLNSMLLNVCSIRYSKLDHKMLCLLNQNSKLYSQFRNFEYNVDFYEKIKTVFYYRYMHI